LKRASEVSEQKCQRGLAHSEDYFFVNILSFKGKAFSQDQSNNNKKHNIELKFENFL
jgi:hypothetical protein